MGTCEAARATENAGKSSRWRADNAIKTKGGDISSVGRDTAVYLPRGIARSAFLRPRQCRPMPAKIVQHVRAMQCDSNLCIWWSSADGRDNCSYAPTFGGESSWLAAPAWRPILIVLCHGTLQLVQWGAVQSTTPRHDEEHCRPDYRSFHVPS